MKRSLSVLIVLLSSIAAFAQGKVGFQTDSLHLVYWGLTGQPVNEPNLAVDLYMGTSSSQLFLYSSTTFGSLAPGKWVGASVLATSNATTGAPAVPGGTTVFVEVQVRDSFHAAPNIFDGGINALGVSAMFNFTLGSGITYPVLWGAAGNWPVGTFNMDNSVYGPGARGAIALIPEPSAISLLGFGATLLFFRPKSTPIRIL